MIISLKKIVFRAIFVACIFLLLPPFLPQQSQADESASITVPPQSSDYQFQFSSLDSGTQFPQDTTLTYQVIYGALSSGNLSSTIHIVINWSNDLSPDNSELLSYILGSATNGYNGSTPVVDLNNHTITWTINAFPAGTTDQILTFQMKSTSNYTGSSSAPFTLSAHMNNEYVTLPTQSITQYYVFNPSLVTPTPFPSVTPTPMAITPTAEPGATPTSTPTLVPTITPTPTPLLQSIRFTSISDTSTTVNIQTTRSVSILANYGTSPQNLSQQITSSSLSSVTNLSFSELVPQTTYYFQLILTQPDGQTSTSEIFSFTTASRAIPHNIDPASVVFVSSDIVLFAPTSATSSAQPMIIVPQKSPYAFHFQLTNASSILSVAVILRVQSIQSILSINSFDPTDVLTYLTQTTPGVFEGSLISPTTPGTYTLTVRITDTTGSISEQKLATIFVSAPLSVIDAVSGNGIEAAQLTFYYQDPRTKQYHLLPQQIFPLPNPQYSDRNGIVRIPLPEGNFKIHTEKLGYRSMNTYFVLNNENYSYPVIQLIPQHLTPLIVLQEVGRNIQDFFSQGKMVLLALANSYRFAQTNAILTLIILCLLSYILLSKTIRIPLASFLHYFLLFTNRKIVLPTAYHAQLVAQDTLLPVSKADIYLIGLNNRVYAHTITSENGMFSFNAGVHKSDILDIFAPGFFPHRQSAGEEKQVIYLARKQRQVVFPFLEQVTKRGISFLFEIVLTLSFIFEFAAGVMLGWGYVLPFMILSGINLILWIIHSAESWQRGFFP